MATVIGAYNTNSTSQEALKEVTATSVGTKDCLDVVIPTPYAERRAYNSVGQVEYIGRAAPGSTEGSAKWQIEKRTYINNRLTKIEWCNGDANFDNLWTGYASFSYS